MEKISVKGGTAMHKGICCLLGLEKPDGIDLAQAARYFGARGEPDPGTRALLARCAGPVLEAAAPRAVWLRAGREALSGLLAGKDIERHLAGCAECVLLGVTLGPGADTAIRRLGVGDIAAGVAADALASALAEQVCDGAEAALRQLAAEDGLYLTGRFSPGYGDWPIEVQPRLAGLLDTSRRIGLCVTDRFLMTPRKSVTALMGLSERPVTGWRAGCGSCALREKCEYRKRGQTCEG